MTSPYFPLSCCGGKLCSIDLMLWRRFYLVFLVEEEMAAPSLPLENSGERLGAAKYYTNACE